MTFWEYWKQGIKPVASLTVDAYLNRVVVNDKGNDYLPPGRYVVVRLS